jgi:hypothetical protein
VTPLRGICAKAFSPRYGTSLIPSPATIDEERRAVIPPANQPHPLHSISSRSWSAAGDSNVSSRTVPKEADGFRIRRPPCPGNDRRISTSSIPSTLRKRGTDRVLLKPATRRKNLRRHFPSVFHDLCYTTNHGHPKTSLPQSSLPPRGGRTAGAARRKKFGNHHF